MILSGTTRAILQLLRLISSLVCLVVYLRADTSRITYRSTYPVLTLLIGIVLLNTAVHSAFEPDPIQTTNFMMLLLGAGSTFLCTKGFAMSVSMTVGSWILVAAMFGGEGNWRHFAIAVFATTVLAVVIQEVQQRALTRLQQSLIVQEDS